VEKRDRKRRGLVARASIRGASVERGVRTKEAEREGGHSRSNGPQVVGSRSRGGGRGRGRKGRSLGGGTSVGALKGVEGGQEPVKRRGGASVRGSPK